MHLGYNLTWDSFTEHSESIFKELCKSKRFSDITLVCDNQKFFKAHKFILSASSDVFKTIFNDETPHLPMIYLRGVSQTDLELILTFVYTGQVSFEQERLDEFLKVANDLKIYGIDPSDILDTKGDRVKTEEDGVDSDEEPEDQDILTKMLPLNSEKLFNPKNPKRRKAQCPTCLKIYNNQTKLRIHHESKHEGVRWPCEHCEYQLTDKSALQKHMKKFHEDVRFNCSLCDFDSAYPSGLTKHMKTHTSDEVSKSKTSSQKRS